MMVWEEGILEGGGEIWNMGEGGMATMTCITSSHGGTGTTWKAPIREDTGRNGT